MGPTIHLGTRIAPLHTTDRNRSAREDRRDVNVSPKKDTSRQDADEKSQTGPLEIDLPMTAEDERALRQQADENYREWLAIIGAQGSNDKGTIR